MSQKSLVEAGQVGLVGYLPGVAFGQYPSSYIVWDSQRRELAARALAEPDGQLPDIICFQEVENIHAIRKLNQDYPEIKNDWRANVSDHCPVKVWF